MCCWIYQKLGICWYQREFLDNAVTFSSRALLSSHVCHPNCDWHIPNSAMRYHLHQALWHNWKFDLYRFWSAYYCVFLFNSRIRSQCSFLLLYSLSLTFTLLLTVLLSSDTFGRNNCGSLDMLLVEVFVFWAVPVRFWKTLWNTSSYSKFHDCALLQVFDTVRQVSLISFVNPIKAGSTDLIWIVDLKSDLTSTALRSHHFVVTGEPVVVALGFLEVRRDVSGPEGLPLLSEHGEEPSIQRSCWCCSLKLADQFYCRCLVSCKLG